MTTWLTETASEEVQGREHTVTIGIKPRAFRKNGSLRVIPPYLGLTGDPQLPHGREGLLDTRFAERLAGQSPQVHIGRGQSHIRMSALGTANVAGAAVYDAKGNVIGRRFDGAWTGADLEWIDIGHKVLEYFPLKPGHPWQFEVRIDSHSGRLVPSPRGWDLQDDSGTPVLWAGRGYLFRPNDPMALTYPVETTVRVQGGKSIYTYTLPAPLPGKTDWRDYTLEPSWESQPGAAEGDDTQIAGPFAAWADNNYGVSASFNPGLQDDVAKIARALLRFSLTLPSGATAITALLQLTRIQGADTTARNVAFHRALVQWFEGAKDAAAPDPGQDGSTWNLRNVNGAVAWGAVGGQSATDYTATATATTAIEGNADYTWNVLADVQAWLTGTTNRGWFIIFPDETTLNTYKGFAASDGLTADQRPKLTVVWVAAGGGSGRGRVAGLGRVIK